MRREMLMIGLVAVLVALTMNSTAQAIIEGEYLDGANTVGLYHFNENTGTTTADDNSLTGRTAYNGTMAGSTLPDWQAGKFGSGLHLPFGNASGVNLGPALNSVASYTLEMYIKWEYRFTSELNYVFTAFGTPGVTSPIAFGRGVLYEHGESPATFGINFASLTYDGWVEVFIPDNFSMQADQWYHVAFVRQWTGVGTYSVYVNGVLANSKTGSGWLGESDLWIGGNTSGALSFGGWIDEVRVSNIARTSFGLITYPVTGQVALGGSTLTDLSYVGIRAEFRKASGNPFVANTLLNSDGTFSIDVPQGIYNQVSIKSYAHLESLFAGMTIATAGGDLGPITLTGGNCDGDGEVSSSDLAVVLANLQ